MVPWIKSKTFRRIEHLESRRLLSTVYVDGIAPGPTHDGSSWTNAYTTLQQSLSAAIAGTTIDVGQGTYTPTTTTDRTASFNLQSGVTIYGGYAGYGQSNPNARNAPSYPTILSGNIGSLSVSTDNSYHVIVANSINSTAVLDGFTITAGNATGTGQYAYGGGVYISAASPMISNCTFKINAATYGGAIGNNASSPNIINCNFFANTGEAIDNETSSPQISGCAFVGNTGVYSIMANLNGSSVSITNCTANDNGTGNCDIDTDTTSHTLVSNSIFDDEGYNGSVYSPFIGSVVTANYSDVIGSPTMYTGTNDILWSLSVVRSPSSGSDGKWGTSDDNYGDLHLLPGTQGVDMGNNSAVPANLTTDLAGTSRFVSAAVQYSGVSEPAIVDMGAYETAATTIIYVDSGATGSNNGSSWANAYTNLQTAFSAAVANQYIEIAGGTYKPTSGTDRTATFSLSSSPSVYGGFAGHNNLAAPGTRNITLYPTILSGDIGVAGVTSDNSNHVVTLAGGESIWNAVTFEDGNADAAGGGAVYANPGFASFFNCNFTNNIASYGGAVTNGVGVGGFEIFMNCAFDGNTATSGRGAAYSQTNPSSAFLNCVFVGNSGGAISGGPVDPFVMDNDQFRNCTFTDNSSPSGDDTLDESNAKLFNCILYNDTGTELASGITTTTCAIGTDPKFVRAPSPGHDGVWGTSDDDYGDLRLQITSLCIDAGTNTAIADFVWTDIANNPRVVDTPGIHDPGAIVDQGAYENPGPVTVLVGSLNSSNQLLVQFSANVVASLAGSDLQLNPVLGGTALSAQSISFNSTTDTATFTLPSLSNGMWTASITASTVNDVPGNFLNSTYTYSFLLVAANQTYRLSAFNQTYTLQQLMLGSSSMLDIGSDTLKINYTAGNDPAFSIASLVDAGYANDQWNGAGIISSILGADTPGTTGVGYFDTGSSVTIRRTWYGDANLDGQINADDLSLMLLGQAQGGTRWQDGNFNYDTQVNADDWIKFMYVNAYTDDQLLSNVAPAFAQTQIASAENLNNLLTSIAG